VGGGLHLARVAAEPPVSDKLCCALDLRRFIPAYALCRLRDVAAGPICIPSDNTNHMCLADLLTAAVAVSPCLGGAILPHLLQPLLECRYTAQKLLDALNELYPDGCTDPQPPADYGSLHGEVAHDHPSVDFDSTAVPECQHDPVLIAAAVQIENPPHRPAAVEPAVPPAQGVPDFDPFQQFEVVLAVPEDVPYGGSIHLPENFASVPNDAGAAVLAGEQGAALATGPVPAATAPLPGEKTLDHLPLAFKRDNPVQGRAHLPQKCSHLWIAVVATAICFALLPAVQQRASSLLEQLRFKDLAGVSTPWPQRNLPLTVGMELLSGVQRSVTAIMGLNLPAVPLSWPEWDELSPLPPEDIPWIACTSFDTRVCSPASLVRAVANCTSDRNRESAVDVLAACMKSFKYAARTEGYPPVIDALAHRLRHDSNKWACDSAGTVEALMSLLPVVSNSINATVGVPHLTRLLSDKADHVKVAAVEALESSARYASTPEHVALAAAAAVPLVGLLQYGTAEMQAAASLTLGFIMPAQEDHRSLLEPLAAIPALVQLLSSGADATSGAAAYALKRFSDDSPYYQRLAASEGAIQPLLQLLRSGSEGAKRRACWALAQLASEPSNQKALEEADFIPHLLQAFATCSPQLRRRVADALVVAADHPANRPALMGALPTLLRWEPAPTAYEAYLAVRKTFAKMVNCSTCTGTTGANDVLAAAVQLLKNGNESDATVRMVTDALQHVAVDPTVRDRIVEAGTVQPLVTLLDRGIAAPYAAAAVGTLEHLARDADKKMLIANASAVPWLIQWIGAEVNASYASAKRSAQETVKRLVTPPANTTTTEGEEAAVAALVQLLGDKNDTTRTTVSSVVKTVAADPRVREMVVTAGGVPPLVRILLDNSDNCKMCVNAAVEALEALTTNAATKRLVVGAGAVEPLVHLIANGDSVAQIAAKMTIRKLITLDQNEVVVAAPDAAPALLRLLSNSTDGAKIAILHTVRDFAADTSLRAIFTTAGAVPILGELMARHDAVGREALHCMHSDWFVAFLSPRDYPAVLK
jgi:hypothetical protein